MTLLEPTASTARRSEVGTTHVHNGLEIHEAKLDWKDNPHWPGMQMAWVKVGEKLVGPRRLRRAEVLRFERQKPKE